MIPTADALDRFEAVENWHLFLNACRDGLDVSPYDVVFTWLKNDYHRLQYCLAMQERYRRLITQGRDRSADAVEFSHERRYREYGHAERRMIGAQQWFTSAAFKDLKDAEQMFSRWATMYGAAT